MDHKNLQFPDVYLKRNFSLNSCIRNVTLLLFALVSQVWTTQSSFLLIIIMIFKVLPVVQVCNFKPLSFCLFSKCSSTGNVFNLFVFAAEFVPLPVWISFYTSRICVIKSELFQLFCAIKEENSALNLTQFPLKNESKRSCDGACSAPLVLRFFTVVISNVF